MTTRSLLAALFLGSVAACATGPGAASPAPGMSGARLYAPNQTSATISIIDASRDSLITTLDLRQLGFSANAKPHDIVVEPDGSAWYVSLIGENTVVKFDRDNRILGRAGTETPGLLALDPVNHRLFATRSMSAVNAPSAIAVIDTRAMTVVEEADVFGPRPHAVAVSPDGAKVYVGSMGTNQVTVYHPESGDAEVFDLAGPTQAVVQFAISPDGRWLVGTAQLTNQLLVYDISGPGMPKQVAAVPVGAWPWLVAFSPDGRWVWFGNQHAGSVTVVDASTWKVAATITDPRLREPHGVAISRDGSTVFISDQGKGGAAPMAGMEMDHSDAGERTNGQIVVIDARTRAISHIIPVDRYTAGIGLGGTR